MVVVALLYGCGGGGGEFYHDEAAQKFIEALKVRTTDEEKCLQLLNEVLEEKPLAAAYFHRAWIEAKRDQIDAAVADTAAGLEVEPEHPDLLWLQGELNKPADKRSLNMPPSATK